MATGHQISNADSKYYIATSMAIVGLSLLCSKVYFFPEFLKILTRLFPPFLDTFILVILLHQLLYWRTGCCQCRFYFRI